MKMALRFLLPMLLMALMLNCNKHIEDAITVIPFEISRSGSDNTLEVVSWNVERFPKHGDTIEDMVAIIRDLDVDIIAFQEITSINDFQALADSLDGYEGRVGNPASSFALWPAVLYRVDEVTLLREELLFTSDTYNFPRAPYALYMRAEKDGRSFDFNLIILHLKAQTDPQLESQQRRRQAILTLEQYVSDQMAIPGNDRDFIIAGDWNDELEDTGSDNVFAPFLDNRSDYRFLTEPFAGSSSEYSFIGGNFRSLIDHIMITASVNSSYLNIETRILKVDEEFTGYLNEVSDHRPVMAKIPVYQ